MEKVSLWSARIGKGGLAGRRRDVPCGARDSRKEREKWKWGRYHAMGPTIGLPHHV